MRSQKIKLYCFVDETGQDTKGKFFLVAVVLQQQENLTLLREKLEDIEKQTKKNLLKWNRTSFRAREGYLNKLTVVKELKGSVFYSTYTETKEYISLIALTIAKSVLFNGDKNYTVTIIIDGLNKKGIFEVRKELKKLKIKYRNIRGMKDEQDAVLRLADSVAGFLRDWLEKQPYTQKIFNKFREAKIIIEV